MMATIAANTNTISSAEPRSERIRLNLRNNRQRLLISGQRVLHFRRFRLKRDNAVVPFHGFAFIGDDDVILIEKETAARTGSGNGCRKAVKLKRNRSELWIRHLRIHGMYGIRRKLPRHDFDGLGSELRSRRNNGAGFEQAAAD